MTQVKLMILGSDIAKGNYCDSENCPITKALARADYPQLKDCGLEIRYKETLDIAIDHNDEDYQKLVNYVSENDGRQGLPDKEFTLLLNIIEDGERIL